MFQYSPFPLVIQLPFFGEEFPFSSHYSPSWRRNICCHLPTWLYFLTYNVWSRERYLAQTKPIMPYFLDHNPTWTNYNSSLRVKTLNLQEGHFSVRYSSCKNINLKPWQPCSSPLRKSLCAEKNITDMERGGERASLIDLWALLYPSCFWPSHG